MAYKQLKLWFDTAIAEMLAKKIHAYRKDFNSKSFIRNITTHVDDLELKPRVEFIADEMQRSLGEDYPRNLKTLIAILGPENEKETGMFKEYYWIMPIAKYVEKYGLDHFELSMQAIEEITKRNTGEYTIRPFLEKHTEQTLVQMSNWSKSQNKHVRRLSSEGLRPRLPWATKLQLFIDDPGPILPILDQLKDDPSKYVQKSVANCLNDILKDNPEIGKKVIENWLPAETPERIWIIRHALRNWRKKKDSWALKIMDKVSQN